MYKTGEVDAAVRWDAVSAISSVVASLTVVIAAWIALRQVRESLSVRKLHETLSVIEQFQSSSVRSTRDFLKRHRAEIEVILAKPKFAKDLDEFLSRVGKVERGPSSLEELRKSFASLEFVAILSLHGRIPLEFERAYLAPTAISYWEAMEPVVLGFRRVGKFNTYLQHFEVLVRLAESGAIYTRRSTALKRREVRRLVDQARGAIALLTDAGRVPVSPDSGDSANSGPDQSVSTVKLPSEGQ